MFQMRAVWKIFAAQLKPKYKIQTWTSSDPRITSTYDQHPQISMCSNFPHRAVRNKSFSSDTITKTRKDINYDKIYDKIRPRYRKKLCRKIPHLVVVDFLARVFLCSSVIRSISLTEQRKHDHKILSTLPIYFFVFLVFIVSSKTQ